MNNIEIVKQIQNHLNELEILAREFKTNSDRGLESGKSKLITSVKAVTFNLEAIREDLNN